MTEKFPSTSIETEPPIERDLNPEEEEALRNKLRELGVLSSAD